MVSSRWRKLGGDLRAMPGRLIAMVLALAVSLVGVGTVLGARTVLRREIAASYLGSHPAEATLELAGDVDAAVLAAVRARPEVAEAEARDVVMARVATGAALHGVLGGDAGAALHGMPGGDHGGDAGAMHGMPGGDHGGDAGAMHGMHGGGAGASGAWQLLQLFVIDDFDRLRLNTFQRDSGTWPPPTGAMLLERTAVGMLGAGEGDTVAVKTRHGAPQPVAIAGIVHDAGLAPAWQERKGYGYVTRDTLAALGEPPVLHELRVSFRPAPATRDEVEAAAAGLAGWLAATGHPVRQLRVPALREHPHQAQMVTAQMALLVFSALLFVLSAILVATLLSAMLARQVREIGVMKALGARAGQLARMYAAAVVAIGAVACLVALPLAGLGAHAMVGAIGGMLNLAIGDPEIPAWVFAVLAAAGIAVPLAVAALPIRRACRLTVREALAQHGARADALRPSLIRLPMAARDALRRPGRLALSLALLTTGGVVATTAFNLKRAYEANIERMPVMWHHDLEIRLSEPAPVALAAQLAAVPGVVIAEPWGYSAPAFAQPGRIDVVHTYPDQGHGSFAVWGVPAGSVLLDLPVIAGRWLEDRTAYDLRRSSYSADPSLRSSGTPGFLVGSPELPGFARSRPGPDDDRAIVVSAMTRRGVGEVVSLSFDGTPSSWTVVGVVDTLPAGGGYVTAAALARATHSEGRARTIRVATTAHAGDELRAIQGRIEREIARLGASVEGTLAFATLRDAMDAHVLVLARAALALALIIALVGLVGLAATIGIGVVARTREIGVMKAIGASDRRMFRLVVGEAVLVGAASWLASAVIAVPVTAAVDRFLTSLGFLSAQLVISPGALAGWLAVVVLGSALAALAPARRAARLTVREALAEP